MYAQVDAGDSSAMLSTTQGFGTKIWTSAAKEPQSFSVAIERAQDGAMTLRPLWQRIIEQSTGTNATTIGEDTIAELFEHAALEALEAEIDVWATVPPKHMFSTEVKIVSITRGKPSPF